MLLNSSKTMELKPYAHTETYYRRQQFLLRFRVLRDFHPHRNFDGRNMTYCHGIDVYVVRSHISTRSNFFSCECKPLQHVSLRTSDCKSIFTNWPVYVIKFRGIEEPCETQRATTTIRSPGRYTRERNNNTIPCCYNRRTDLIIL